MASIKPQPRAQKKSPKKIKILQIKRSQQKSFFSEYFYQTLLVVFAVLTFLLMGFGMRWDESGVIALWIVAILFVARQTWRAFRREADPAKPKEKKPVVLAEPVRNYKAPEVPRVSKDFSPLPPPGDKRYPPPSPFIKPPKAND
jgi:hypothetical protein